MPIPEKIKLPEPGLPKGLESEDDLPVTPAVPDAPNPPGSLIPKPGTATGPPSAPSKPSAPPVPKPGEAKIELPKPGLPKPSDESKPDLPKLPDLPKPTGDAPKPPVPPKQDSPPVSAGEKGSGPEKPKAEEKSAKNLSETDTDIQVDDQAEAKQDMPEDNAKEKEKSNLQKDLLKEFDTDGDGQISKDEKPSEEQLKQFTKRRREKPHVDQVDSKRKSRIEAETAVKNAMRELEEARVREELSAREELEAHKLTLDKAKKELARNDEERGIIKQTDQS